LAPAEEPTFPLPPQGGSVGTLKTMPIPRKTVHPFENVTFTEFPALATTVSPAAKSVTPATLSYPFP
jgi:hypothetical protein